MTRSRKPGKTPKRGEIWWVSLDPTVGAEIQKTRPCVVLSIDLVNRHRETVVIVPLSSSPNTYPPIRVSVTCKGQPSVAVVDQIRGVSKNRLQRRLGIIGPDDLDAIEDALKRILALG